MKRVLLYFWLCSMAIWLSSCSLVKATGQTAKFIGKATWETVKLTGKIAYGTSKAAGYVVKTAVHIARGKQVVSLKKQGNSLFADVKINRRVKALLLVDTGASQMQISQALAKRLNIDPSQGEPVQIKVAGGQIVTAVAVNLKKVRIGRARVTNVRAIILDREMPDSHEGLLGMSFLNHFIFQIDAEKSKLILQRKN